MSEQSKMPSAFVDERDLLREFGAAALDQARGPAEIAEAALAVLFDELEHDPDDWGRLSALAAPLRAAGTLSTRDWERIQGIDEHVTDDQWERLLAKVRDGYAKAFTPEELKQMAVRTQTEDERPPMQFAADEPWIEIMQFSADDADLYGVSREFSKAQIEGQAARRLAQQQLKATGRKRTTSTSPSPTTRPAALPTPQAARSLAQRQVQQSGYGRRGSSR